MHYEEMVKWRYERLLEEADRERLAARATRRSGGVRIRLALALYALAGWLSPEPTFFRDATKSRKQPLLASE